MDSPDHLLANPEAFNSYLYTPLQEAILQVKKRAEDSSLDAYLSKVLPYGLPSAFEGKRPCLTLFRNIATPNYETNRFLACGDTLQKDFDSLILEYTNDMFQDRSSAKYFLGKLRFQKGYNKVREFVFENINTINFNSSNGMHIRDVKTLWGQNLVDFHHELFHKRFPDLTNIHADISEWISLNGQKAQHTYKPFLSLFLKYGILFENFLTSGPERSFTSSVVLPTINEIEEETGYRPLVVALDPSELEGDDFWFSYPYAFKQDVLAKLTNDVPPSSAS